MNYFHILIISVFLLTSCKKWDKEEKIPSYISIYQSSLQTEFATQGAASSNIADVWVNIDGNRQGTYEIPTTFPVLETGRHKVTLRAGIKVNGIAASRIIYPFFDMINMDTVLQEGKTVILNPVYSYKPATVFAWREDFQGNGFSLDRAIESDTLLYVISDSTGNKYGKFSIDAIRQRFYYKSAEAHLLPKNGTAIFLEFDYRCNHPFTVGLLINKLQTSVNTPILVVNPHPTTFNHIYVDLSYVVNYNLNAIDFNVIFQAVLQDGYTTGDAEIDNVKLIHF
ncbi:MAG: hypothetical protein Fur0028_10970 [Bacteroidales bacterium]